MGQRHGDTRHLLGPHCTGALTLALTLASPNPNPNPNPNPSPSLDPNPSPNPHQVRVGFGVEAAKGGAWEFEVIVDFLFLFDVVVNFRSSYRYASP